MCSLESYLLNKPKHCTLTSSNFTNLGVETLCSLIGVCSQLSYDDNKFTKWVDSKITVNLRPVQTMTKEQKILTMDKPMDSEGKIGGYDNTAAIAFFDKYKNGDVSLFFFFTFGIKNKKKL